MPYPLRLRALAALCLLLTPLHAQTLDRAATHDARALSLTVRSLVELLREAVLSAPEPDLGLRLRPLTQSLVAFDATTPPDSFDTLEAQIQHVLDDVQRLRDDLRAEGAAVTAGRLDPIVEGLRDALSTARHVRTGQDAPPHRFAQNRDYDSDDRAVEGREGEDTDWHTDEWEEHHDDHADYDNDRRDRWKRYQSRHALSSRIGEEVFWEDALVRQSLPVRYNRVEGFYLGIKREPLEVNAWRPARIFGEAGYAFGLEKLRYSAGLDVRVTPPGPYAVKVGGLYRHGTTTNDDWKANPIENALGSFFARSDFYDYYDTEGWTVYAEGQLHRMGRVQAGYRNEKHQPLTRNVTWAFFGGDAFRLNPLADAGRMHSFIGIAELGRVRGLTSLPRGAALRLEGEWGQGTGGDFDFTRLVADGRLYVPTSRQSSLSLRARAGTVVGDGIPFQKGFTLGGVGSVRAYPQNVFYGTQMVTATAEFALAQPGLLDDLLDDLQLFGFADYGWTGNSSTFALNNGVADVGIGIGLDDRRVRLELAFPLRDEGYGLSPTLWLRIAPPF